MFDYVTVPAGAPASTQGLADHLMGRTLGPDTGRALERMTGIGTVEVRPDLHPMVAEALGIDLGRPLDAQEVSALFAGRRADGRPIEGKRRIAGQVGSVDVTMTADKSVSVAWAFARSVEQAAIYQAHRSASEAALRALVGRIGVARRGQGGKGGAEPGHVAWLSFDHFTARPTWDGELVAGDPNLHTHHTIMSAVFTGSHVGSLSLRDMEAMKKDPPRSRCRRRSTRAPRQSGNPTRAGRRRPRRGARPMPRRCPEPAPAGRRQARWVGWA